MERIVIKFGLISGFILAALMAILVPMCLNGHGPVDFENSVVIGYAAMVLAFLLVYFGIRSYRDNVAGGAITFGRAFKVGILIALVTCAVYVIGWEIVYWNFIPDFADKYAALSLEKMRADGATAAQLAEAQKKMDEFKVAYKNPFFNVGMTFLEVFPAGLIVTLISAAILRRRTPAGYAPAAAA